MGATRGQRHGGLLDGRGPVAQPGGQHLLQLGQRAEGGLGDAGDRLTGGRLKADGHRDGLVVVQEQGRQGGACPEAVAAGHAGGGVDGVAEVAEALDVAAEGAGGDGQAGGQLGAGPLGTGLEQRQQSQQAGRGVEHESESGTD